MKKYLLAMKNERYSFSGIVYTQRKLKKGDVTYVTLNDNTVEKGWIAQILYSQTVLIDGYVSREAVKIIDLEEKDKTGNTLSDL